jgi:hypothetical protein
MKFLTAGNPWFQEYDNGQLFLSCVTNRTAAATPLTQSDGSQLTIPNNTALGFNFLIGGRGTGGTNDTKVGYYQLTGIAKNINGTLTVVAGSGGGLTGRATVYLVQIEEVSGWDVAVVASGTTLSFQVSGDTGTVVQWRAVGQLLYI